MTNPNWKLLDLDEEPLGNYRIHVDADFAGEYLRRGVDGPDALHLAISRIIAAAPAMLQELERLAESFGWGQDHPARSAINLARGIGQNVDVTA